MPSIITTEGDALVSERLIGATDELASEIAVGTGTATPVKNDRSLSNEVFRSTSSDSNVSIEPRSSDPREIITRITVSGGTEVPAGTTLTEIGLFGDQGSLVYRETFTGVTIDSGDRETFEFVIEVNS